MPEVCDACGRSTCEDMHLCDVPHLTFEEAEARCAHSDDRVKWANDTATVLQLVRGEPIVDRTYKSEAVEDEAVGLYSERERKNKMGRPILYAGRDGVLLLLKNGYTIKEAAEVLKIGVHLVIENLTFNHKQVTTDQYLAAEQLLRVSPTVNYTAIAEAVGLDRRSVANLGTILGIEPTKKVGQYTTEQKDQARAMREAGVSVTEIMEATGLPTKNAVMYALHGHKRKAKV